MLFESATHTKNHLGEIIDAALREPVCIQRAGRNTVVMMAYEEYEELRAIADKTWGKEASSAKQKGMIGTQASADEVHKKMKKIIVTPLDKKKSSQ